MRSSTAWIPSSRSRVPGPGTASGSRPPRRRPACCVGGRASTGRVGTGASARAPTGGPSTSTPWTVGGSGRACVPGRPGRSPTGSPATRLRHMSRPRPRPRPPSRRRGRAGRGGDGPRRGGRRGGAARRRSPRASGRRRPRPSPRCSTTGRGTSAAGSATSCARPGSQAPGDPRRRSTTYAIAPPRTIGIDTACEVDRFWPRYSGRTKPRMASNRNSSSTLLHTP